MRMVVKYGPVILCGMRMVVIYGPVILCWYEDGGNIWASNVVLVLRWW